MKKKKKIREKELKEKLILEQQELIEEKLKEPVECRSVILRGLKTTTTEETIIDALKIFGAVEDVRIIRDKGTGESRGFAFVDFFTIEEAKAFMEYNNGSIIIDGCKIQLDYSKPIKPFVFPSGTSFSSGGPIFMTQPPQEFKDWICPQVWIQFLGNFKFRNTNIPFYFLLVFFNTYSVMDIILLVGKLVINVYSQNLIILKLA